MMFEICYHTHAAPSSPPTGLQAFSVDSMTIMLTWNTLSQENHNGIIRDYIINVTELDTGHKFQQTSAVASATVSFLHPYYTYRFAVAASTVAVGPFSAPIELTTPEDGKLLQMEMLSPYQLLLSLFTYISLQFLQVPLLL